jgi:hypothetical protein
MKCTNSSENLIFDQPIVTKQKTMCLLVLFASRVADPDPGSGIRCLLTPGSWAVIRNMFFPDPGCRIHDRNHQLSTNLTHIIFCTVKILCTVILWKLRLKKDNKSIFWLPLLLVVGSGIRDGKQYGSGTRDGKKSESGIRVKRPASATLFGIKYKHQCLKVTIKLNLSFF